MPLVELLTDAREIVGQDDYIHYPTSLTSPFSDSAVARDAGGASLRRSLSRRQSDYSITSQQSRTGLRSHAGSIAGGGERSAFDADSVTSVRVVRTQSSDVASEAADALVVGAPIGYLAARGKWQCDIPDGYLSNFSWIV